MTLDMLLAVVDDSTSVAVQVVDPETKNYVTLVGPVNKTVLNRVLRGHLDSEIFTRTVESVRIFDNGDSHWPEPELFIGVI